MLKRNGPIVIIDDDRDDHEIMVSAMEELGLKNEIIFFSNGLDALKYLSQQNIRPLCVISDINMPGITGFELRDMVLQDAKLLTKCVPFIFLTTGSTAQIVQKAYSQSVQGFFTKPSNMNDFKRMMRSIVEYWQIASTTNSFAREPL